MKIRCKQIRKKPATSLSKYVTNHLAIFVTALVLGLSSFNVFSSAGTHHDNPFLGAVGYINEDYVKLVDSSISVEVGPVAKRMELVKQYPTAVWLDRIDAVTGINNNNRLSLEQHLLSAVDQQKAANKPLTFLVVVYNLPDRDCAASASNGTLDGTNGLEAYKSEFIDVIAGLFADARFSDIRIVAILEPDSLPNLVTNLSIPGCAKALQEQLYTSGIQYALQKFGAIANVYTYLDVGHSGWLGWDNNRELAAKLYYEVVNGSGNLANVDGFVSNVSGYTPTEEPFLADPYAVAGDGQQLLSAQYYSYNALFDERDYVEALYQDFVSAGFANTIGMLIDTSRNGWGGDQRPAAISSSVNVDDFVEDMKIDKRPARGNWCNQAGAGIGATPRAEPYGEPPIDAFVWIKPPGESDGTSDSSQLQPDAQGKSFDEFCAEVEHGGLPNAPAAGTWFPQQFKMLVNNAYPPLSAESVAANSAETINTTDITPNVAAVAAAIAAQISTEQTEDQTDAPSESTPIGCKVDFELSSIWSEGYVASVVITNTGSLAIDGWSLTWNIQSNASISNAWNMDLAVDGTSLKASNVDWNRTLAPGASAKVGYAADYTGPTAGAPEAFLLNDVLCD